MDILSRQRACYRRREEKGLAIRLASVARNGVIRTYSASEAIAKRVWCKSVCNGEVVGAYSYKSEAKLRSVEEWVSLLSHLRRCRRTDKSLSLEQLVQAVIIYAYILTRAVAYLVACLIRGPIASYYCYYLQAKKSNRNLFSDRSGYLQCVYKCMYYLKVRCNTCDSP